MTNSPRLKIGAVTSLVLDGLRLLAALVVVVFHASGLWAIAHPALHAALGKASHAAVVVFFVISGYVIAFTTAGHDRGPRHYAAARLSRLYAVLGPALVVTALVEYAVLRSDAGLTARYVHAFSGVRYLLSLVFGSEAGFWSAAPPLNSPLWSLSYEFWYYALFGLWFYRRSLRQPGLLLAVAGVLAGPKVLLLLPIWLAGGWAFRWSGPRLPAGVGALLAAGLLGLAGLAAAYLPAWPMAVGERPLFMSGQFGTDWVVGALVAGSLWVLPGGLAAGHGRWVKRLRAAADLSFPLYALHFPLLVLARLPGPWPANDWWQLGAAVLLVGMVAAMLGVMLDRQRPRWMRLLNWGLGLISKRWVGGR